MSATLELNWQSDVNRYADATYPAEWLPWYLAKGLSSQAVSGITAGLWTVIASSNGVDVGEQDYWDDTFDAANIVAANPGTAHSWILLESPSGLTGGPYYMLIDCSHVGHPESVRILFSVEEFDLTSLSTENAPVTTDPDAMMVFDAQTVNVGNDGVYLGTFDVSPPIPQHYAHLRVASTGEFVFNTTYASASSFYSHVHFLQMRDSLSVDTKPVQALALGGGYVSGIEIDQTGGFPDYSGLGGNAFSENNYPSIARLNRNNGYADATSAQCFGIPYATIKKQYCFWAYTGGMIEGNYSLLVTVPYNEVDKSLMCPAVNCFSTNGLQGNYSNPSGEREVTNYRGRVPDVFVCPPVAYKTTPEPAGPIAINQGDVSPVTTEGDPFLFVKIGSFWFPWKSTELPFM